MKKVIDCVKSFYPNCNEIQIAHLESLIKDLVGNKEQLAYGQGYKDGRVVGTKEGERSERANWSGWSSND